MKSAYTGREGGRAPVISPSKFPLTGELESRQGSAQSIIKAGKAEYKTWAASWVAKAYDSLEM